ncbi:MAG TPA: DUF1015 domain-containing protein [Candidatus Avilachnospira avistercoris]|nr:DUF1015 domain-containing protein [Candidatus Avilachnospira avistercoris]
MADIRPFRAVRPREDKAALVAALPYDVYSRKEAADFVKSRPLSFLNIDRPETAFPPTQDMYAKEVYDHAAELYEAWKKEGVFIRDEESSYYIYELRMGERTQTGIAALSSVDDYLNGVCRKHENTVEAKEQDRIRHVDRLSAQTGPIFLSYHDDRRIDELVSEAKKESPLYDVISEDGISHRLWKISDAERVEKLRGYFSELSCTYIADGHHRAASAVKVALKRREEAKERGEETVGFHEYDGFLSVLFPDTELRIYDYNRVVSSLNGLSESEFLKRIGESFDIEKMGTARALETSEEQLSELMRPKEKYEIGLYIGGSIYKLRLRDELRGPIASDPRRRLDVSVLQELVLSPILSIEDPRTDKRISFVGGIRGLSELLRLVDDIDEEKKGADMGAAFAMYPTSMEELFAVADAGLLMPPKSTWFEPKLRSGFLIHEF